MTPTRVLVVEDQAAKASKIVELLLSSGLCNRESVQVAASSSDAKNALLKERYDLMILDVVLPIRVGGELRKEGGVELLRELMERDQMRRPAYVVGLTAFPDAFQAAAGEFADYTWAIIQYSEGNAGWHDPILQLLRHIERSTKQRVETTLVSCDICVVTALQEELDALLACGWAWSNLRIPGDATTYRQSLIEVGGESIRVIAAASSRMGMVHASVLSANMIRTFRPMLISMVGICAGLKARVNLGDVVVADPSWDYQSGKLEDGEFQIAPHQLPLLTAVRRRIFDMCTTEYLQKVRRNWEGKLPAEPTRFHLGPFASGSAVLADRERLEQLTRQHRSLVAIDMEVYGVYAAAAEAAVPAPHAVAIKGVSDFGDAAKSDDVRAFAAYMSASVFRDFVLREFLGLREFLRGWCVHDS